MEPRRNGYEEVEADSIRREKMFDAVNGLVPVRKGILLNALKVAARDVKELFGANITTMVIVTSRHRVEV